jgi:hypothetical protein
MELCLNVSKKVMEGGRWWGRRGRRKKINGSVVCPNSIIVLYCEQSHSSFPKSATYADLRPASFYSLTLPPDYMLGSFSHLKCPSQVYFLSNPA